MSDNTIPAHLETLLTGLRDDPSLAAGATTAAGTLTGTQRAEAAATYYRSKGYEVTAEELSALEIARKSAVGAPLSDDELETVAGGMSIYTPDVVIPFWEKHFPAANWPEFI